VVKRAQVREVEVEAEGYIFFILSFHYISQKVLFGFDSLFSARPFAILLVPMANQYNPFRVLFHS